MLSSQVLEESTATNTKNQLLNYLCFKELLSPLVHKESIKTEIKHQYLKLLNEAPVF